MSKPDSHVFRGVKYRLRWRQPRGYSSKMVAGACSPPSIPEPIIEISPRVRGLEKLMILIDEAIHACHWDLDNDSVGETSEAVAAFLWRCGVRFIEDENNQK